MKTKTTAHRELANIVSNETSRYVNINTSVSLYAKDVEELTNHVTTSWDKLLLISRT